MMILVLSVTPATVRFTAHVELAVPVKFLYRYFGIFNMKPGYRYLIYLLTAIGLTLGGSSTVHIYTQIIHRTIQNKQYIEQHNNFGRVRAVPRLG